MTQKGIADSECHNDFLAGISKVEYMKENIELH
jgi:hypothetical protein